MKKLLIIAVVSAVTFLVWRHQRPVLEGLRVQNERLAAVAAELTERARRAESARQSAEQQLTSLRAELNSRLATAPDQTNQNPGPPTAPSPEPDPAHQGGWPSGAGFFYLPKQYLTNASYQLLSGGQLTDEAAALLGMSPPERESTDNAFGELLNQFRRVEIQRMEPVAPPAGWSVGASSSAGAPGLPFDSALTYHIPDLSKDISAAQTAFLGQLQQDLGASRAGIVASAADSYLRQNLDDLGAGDRIVGFVWQPESDGTHSLWYAAADARKGEGAFQRVGEDLDPNSQTAYYAQLFGIRLPGH
jgi:hypothetical protein